MSERRRSLFVLLIVLGLIAGSLYVISKKDTKLGLDLQGGVQLIYEGKPTAQQPTVTQEALQRSLEIMRERVDAFGVAEPELLQTGDNADRGQPAGRRGRRARRAAGRLHRPVVLLRLGSQHPRRELPDGPGRERQQPPGDHRLLQRRQAGLQVRRAGRRQQQRRRRAALLRVQQGDQAAVQQRRAVGVARGRARGPDATRSARTPRCSRCPRASSSCATRSPTADAPEPDRFWVVQDNPALSGTDIRNPEQNFDEQRQPIVTFDFTDEGREAFQEITAEIAQRGVDNALPTDNPERLPALRDRARRRAGLGAVHQLRREPGRDRRLDGRSDLRQLHDPGGAGPGADPRDRRAADPARAGLALAGLRLARRPGARPGPGRRPRRLRDRRALPDRLLPRAGRDRRRRDGASTGSTSTRWSCSYRSS